MKRRKRMLMVVATVAVAAGLLPASAAARSFALPAYNPGAAVTVTSDSSVAVDVVSWGD
jgi:hypothetical protein